MKKLLISLSATIIIALIVISASVGIFADETHSHIPGDWIDSVPAGCQSSGTLGHYHCDECGADLDSEYNVLESIDIAPRGHYYTIANMESNNGFEYDEEQGMYYSTNHDHSSSSNITFVAVSNIDVEIYYRVSSEEGCDKLTLIYNGVNIDVISGPIERNATISLSVGDHLEIIYSKDGSVNRYNDTGYFSFDLEYTVEGATPLCERDITCDSCGVVFVEAIGHDIIYHDAQDPTCTEAGWYEYENCSRCNYSSYSHINANGHSYENNICTACGDVRTPYNSWDISESNDGSVIANMYYDQVYGGYELEITGSGNMKTWSSYYNVPWYNYSGSIKSVTIDSQITSIGNYAFYNCYMLTSVNIPGGVTTIGTQAFYNCYALTDISLPDSLTSIGVRAFYGCSSLTSVNIPENVTSIGNYAFYNCIALTEIHFDATEMNDLSSNNYVFYYAGNNSDGITVTVGSNVTKIPAYLFYSNTNGTSYIPKITRVVFEDSSVCESIGNYAFYYSDDLQSINVPNTITTIGNYAFYYCDDLQSFSIPEGVTSIGEYAFYFCDDLQSISIPEGVTSIGNYTFYSCTSLTSVSLPDSLTSIGEYAFQNCTSLTSINIPESMTSIGTGAFRYCYALVEIRFDATAMNDLANNNCVFYYAGYNTDGIAVTIGSNVTKMPAYLFYPYQYNSSYFPKITSVVFEEGSVCESIGNYAFYYCDDFYGIILPDSVTTIGAYAFYYASNLSYVYIPSSVTYIDNYAFYGYGNVKFFFESEELPTYVGSSWNSSGYSSYYFNTQEVYNIDGAIYVVFGDGTAALVKYSGTASEYEILSYIGDAPVTTIYANAFIYNNYIEKVIIPNTVTTIGSNAFYECYNLKSVIIPASVTTIGSYVFSGHSAKVTVGFESDTLPENLAYDWGGYGTNAYLSVREIVVLDDSTYVITSDGAAILSKYFGEASEYEILSEINGASVTQIGAYAFYGKGTLISITIPSYITSIGNDAFNGTNIIIAFTSSELPENMGGSWQSNADYYLDVRYVVTINDAIYVITNDGVASLAKYIGDATEFEVYAEVNGYTVTRIGRYAFFDKYNLQSITIPNSITSIGNSAFSNCRYLTSIVIPNSVTSMGHNVFYCCYNLKEVTLSENIDTIGDYAFQGCSSLESIVIPEGVTHIGYYAFQGCSSLTSIVLPTTLRSIDYWAFGYCSSLTEIVIPEGVTSINQYTFYSCTNLATVVLPSTLTNIDYQAFYYCTALTEIVIPEGVTSINGYAFYNCTNLAKVVLPYTLTSIGYAAFYNCTALTEIVIPRNVDSIDNSAFYNTGIKVVYIESGTIAGNISSNSSYGYLLNGVQTVLIAPNIQNVNSYIVNNYTSTEAIIYNGVGYISYSNHTHSWSEHEVLSEYIACVQDGCIRYVCDTCGAYKDVDTFKHAVIVNSAQDPDCCNIGWYEYHTCERCDYTTYEEIPALGHRVIFDTTEWIDSVETQNDSNYPFDFVDGIYNSTNKYSSSTSYFTITALYDCTLTLSYKVSSEANYDIITISKNGYDLYSVSGERDWQTVEITLAAGDYVTVRYRKDGSVDRGSDTAWFYYECTQTEVGGLLIVPADDVDPTCTADVVCDFCGTLVKEALGHDMVAVDSQDPTCTEVGWYEHAACSRCDYNTKVEIDMLGHRYLGTVTPPTCTEQGYTTYVCERCDDTIIDEYVSANGHNYLHKSCTVCGESQPADMTWDISYYGDGSLIANLYTNTSDGTYELEIVGSGDMASWYDYYNVPWYDYRSQIIIVDISEGVTSIGNYAFYYCTSLTSVNVTEGVTSIGNYAFYYCTSLTSISLPDSLTSIGSYAFYNCTSLTSINIPKNITSLGSRAFYNCYSLTEIRFEATELGNLSSSNYMFYNAGVNGTGITVIIGSNVKRIPSYLFYPVSGNSGLVKIIGVRFEENSVCDYIGAYAFRYCTDIGYVIIPSSVTSIGNYAFYGCSNITFFFESDSFPSSVGSSWKDSSAAYYFNVKEVAFADDALYVVFNDDTAMLAKYSGTASEYEILSYIGDAPVTTICANAFRYNNYIEKVIIPDTITTIGDYAFYDCYNLKSIIIPSSVTTIGSCVFSGYGANVTVGFEADTLPENLSYNWGNNGTKAYLSVREIIVLDDSTYVITNDGATILSKYFGEASEYEMLSEINGASVTQIGAYAFYGNNNLKTFTVPSYITHIGNDAFNGTNIIIAFNSSELPENLGGSWYGNSGYYVNVRELVILEDAIYVITNDGVATFAKYLGYEVEYTVLREINGYTVTVIGDSAFRDNYNLQSVIIPDSITSIGNYAFCYCGNLTSIVIPNSVTSMGNNVFEGCYNLKEVTLSENLDTIGSYAFIYCYALENIVIPEGVTSIGGYAFYNCNNLKRVVLPTTLRSIDAYAFAYCYALKEIVIPANVTNIGSNAFYSTELNVVYIESSTVASNLNSYYSYGYLLNNAKTVIIAANIQNVNSYITNNFTNTEAIIYNNVGYVSYSNHYHSWSEYGVISEYIACVQDGCIRYQCYTCNAYKDVITLCHTFSGAGVIVPPTCTDRGYTVYSCDRCGESYASDYVSANGHSYEATVTYPTCTEGGYTTHICSVCQDTFVDSYTSPHGHQYSGTVIPPTCTEQGYTLYECWYEGCDDSYRDNYVDALGHYVVVENREYIELLYLQSSNQFYFDGGYYFYSENHDDNSISEIYFSVINDHYINIDFGVSSEPNYDKLYVYINDELICEISGQNNYCLYRQVYSGDVIKISYSKDGSQSHNSDYAWFYLHSGLGYDNVTYENVPVDDVDPTCTQNVVCESCQVEFKAALGHDAVYHSAQAPTCTEIGWYEYETCTRCDHTTYVEIPANGHNYEATVTYPTCTEDGYTTHVCSVCQDTYVDSPTSALGHSYNNGTLIDPTCTEQGYTLFECYNCPHSYQDYFVSELGHYVLYGYCEYITNLSIWEIADFNDYGDYFESINHEPGSESTLILQVVNNHTLVIDYGVSSEQNFDKLRIYVNGYRRVEISGEQTGTLALEVYAGDSITIQYSKDGSVDSNSDMGWVYISSGMEYVVDATQRIPVDDIDPTCTEGVSCDDCHVEFKAALGHDMLPVNAQSPTCTEVGWYAYEDCSRCDHNTKVEIEATGHDCEYDIYIVEPTCSEYGYLRFECHCGYYEMDDIIPSVGHNYSYRVEVIAPTCTASGYTKYTCECGLYTTSNYVASTGHQYTVTTIEATCEENGYTLYKCSKCEDSTQFNVVAALGHDLEYNVMVAIPTCEREGFTRHSCRCGLYYDSDYVEPLGHNVELNVRVIAPTCTEDGYTLHKCRCEMSYRDNIVSATGHNYSADPVAPTCEDDGYTYYVCHCGDNYIDDYVAAFGHDYAHTVTPPTCTTQGYTTHRCICGDMYIDSYTDALGHSYVTTIVAPECEEQGYTVHECDCGDIVYEDYVDATGHSHELVESVEPNCTERGYRVYACHCGDEYTEYEDALGHSHYLYDTVYATCTEDGYEVYKCDCGNTYTDIFEFKTGHYMGEWVVIKEPTCLDPGVYEAKCDNCDYTTIESTDPLGHSYETTVIDPTCEEGGYTKYECDCGDSYQDDFTSALGHDYTSNIVDATCVDDGYTEYLCACGHSYIDNTVAAKGHSYDNWRDEDCNVCGAIRDVEDTTAEDTTEQNTEITTEEKTEEKTEVRTEVQTSVETEIRTEIKTEIIIDQGADDSDDDEDSGSKKKGCRGAMTSSAIVIVLAAAASVGFISKKKED